MESGVQHQATSSRTQKAKKGKTAIYRNVVPAMHSWRLYHFHDTSSSALVKQIHNVNDNEYLREDARNLAAFYSDSKTITKSITSGSSKPFVLSPRFSAIFICAPR